MKRSTLLMVCLIPFVLTGCSGCESAEQKDRRVVEKQQSHYATAQPVPFFDWSLERDFMVQLQKKRNEAVRTWTVWRSDTGIIEGHTESIGFPLPYDVQLTNPLAREGTSSNIVVEQAEPNGLFSSKNTSATWIRSVVNHNGKVMEVPIYVEGKVTCYPYPIVVDYEKNRVTRAEAGDPTVVLEKSVKK